MTTGAYVKKVNCLFVQDVKHRCKLPLDRAKQDDKLTNTTIL